MKTVIFSVVGVTFEGRQEIIRQLTGYEACRIVPEPDNPYDKNALAVQVKLSDEIVKIGYVAKDRAAQLAPLLQGENVLARIEEITGGFAKWDGSKASLGVRIRAEFPSEPDGVVLYD